MNSPMKDWLSLATSLTRVMVTQDIRFRVLAEDCNGAGEHSRIDICAPTYVSFGEIDFHLELISKATDADTGRIGLTTPAVNRRRDRFSAPVRQMGSGRFRSKAKRHFQLCTLGFQDRHFHP